MYALEYKQTYIVKEPLLKNRTCQSIRWKQAAICEDATTLEKIRSQKRNPSDWRVIPLGDSVILERTEK